MYLKLYKLDQTFKSNAIFKLYFTQTYTNRHISHTLIQLYQMSTQIMSLGSLTSSHLTSMLNSKASNCHQVVQQANTICLLIKSHIQK
jgi:hypothetical protein